MKKAFIISVVFFSGFFSYAHANSYFDMITRPPVEQVATAPALPEVSYFPSTNNETPPAAPIKAPPTAAPVVSPAQELEKYQAWLKAKQQQNNNSALNKETIQNMIYMIETGLLGVGLYEIYRYK